MCLQFSCDMMSRYTCSVCYSFSAPTYQSVIRHIGSVHSWEPRFNVTCGVEGCPRTYTSYRSFRKHLLEKHQEVMEIEPHTTVELTDIQGCHEQTDNNTPTDQAQIPPNSKALLLLKMKEDRRISQSSVDGLITDITVLLQDEILSLKNDVISCIQQGQDLNDSISKVDQLFAQKFAASPFQGLETAYLQRKYFIDHFHLVEPVERKLGRTVCHICKGSKSYVKLCHDYVYDVPLLASIHQQLCDEHILEEVLRGHGMGGEVLGDYCDGSLFQKHPLFSVEPRALQIMLYFDELEVCNPLGSSAKVHKLGIFYYQLGNISPKYRSSLRSIHLVSIAKSSVVQKYGPDKILESFMNDVKKLEQESGVEFQIGSETYTFRGTLTIVAGDNQGSHFIGGYKQLSSALRKCRYCMAVSEDMLQKFFADNFQPRTRETHQHHCSQLDGPMYAHIATTYGVYRDCILNSSNFFHICDGLAPDIMHDILEGSLQYEVKELLKHLILSEHFFTLKELNESIERFPYVAPDKATKPSIIAPQVLSSSDKSLKQKASEMWCLARFLPLMIGNRVPEDDSKWELFLNFLTILDYVFAPSTNLDIVAYVRLLIGDHLTRFRELYPDCSIIPKQHYMVHIPEWMERCGPMTRYWCMRFEGKHNYFKDLAHRTKCFKNIAKSLSHRHQRLVCYHLAKSQSLVKEMETGKVSQCEVDDLEYGSQLIKARPTLSHGTKLHRLKWVQMQGTKYQEGSIVVLGSDILPTFGRIIDIVVVDVDNPLFICEVLKTEEFISHVHAFVVKTQTPPIPITIVKQEELTDHHVLGLYKLRLFQDSFSFYVVPKYHII